MAKTKEAVEGKLSQVLKELFGSLEVQLLEMEGEEWGEEEEDGWSNAHCPKLARDFYIHGI